MEITDQIKCADKFQGGYVVCLGHNVHQSFFTLQTTNEKQIVMNKRVLPAR